MPTKLNPSFAFKFKTVRRSSQIRRNIFYFGIFVFGRTIFHRLFKSALNRKYFLFSVWNDFSIYIYEDYFTNWLSTWKTRAVEIYHCCKRENFYRWKMVSVCYSQCTFENIFELFFFCLSHCHLFIWTHFNRNCYVFVQFGIKIFNYCSKLIIQQCYKRMKRMRKKKYSCQNHIRFVIKA